MIFTKVYLHNSKETMMALGERIGLTGPALDYFSYTCYVVELTLQVDSQTGFSTITEVNNIPLEKK